MRTNDIGKVFKMILWLLIVFPMLFTAFVSQVQSNSTECKWVWEWVWDQEYNGATRQTEYKYVYKYVYKCVPTLAGNSEKDSTAPKKYSEAIRTYDELVNHDPSMSSYLLRAEAKVEMGDYQGSINDFNRVE